MKQLAVIFILLISNLAHSQSFEIVLGDSTQNCTAKSIVTMGSKVSILVSCTSSGGTYNNFIYQYDSMGQYINSFELPVNELIVERMVLSGNNFLVCGSVYDSTGDAQAFLMMADTNYNILWEKRFGALSTDESFNGVCTLPDKSITGCGYTQNPSGSGNAIYAVKTDSSGNFIWEQFYTSAFSSTADQILSLNDGTLVISGDRSSSSGLFNNVTMRIDSSSSLIWEHESLNPYNNGCKNDLYTSDGNVLVVGESATATSPFF
ncbi:MAG: hypothetical protein ABI772_15620, partial [Bacteroidota bacterium]